MTDGADQLAALLEELRVGCAASVPRSLPARVYSSAAFHELEIERIFTTEWLLVARADEITEAGDRLTVEIAGEPVIIVRGDDGELRALSGVCRHRYFPVTEPGFGHGPRLTCAYHRWSYGLDGRCRAAPLMDDAAGFDIAEVSLPELGLEVWEGFVFVSLDPDAPPLAPRLEPIAAELEHHRLADQHQMTRYDSTWAGNWKAAVENGSESYHHLGLHSRTVQPYMPARGSVFVESTDDFAWHRTPITRLAARHGAHIAHDVALTDDDLGSARFFTIFPATIISVVGDAIDWLTFLPCGPDRVQAMGGFVFRHWEIEEDEMHDLAATQAKAGERINDEDRSSVERLQHVVGSRFATPGRLNPREGAVAAFGAYLARRVLGEQTPAVRTRESRT